MADIITYPENGITYDADDAAGYLATRQSGVYSAEEDFAVTAAEGLSVQVSAGHAWVHPTRWLGRSIIMEQPTTVVLTEADPVRSRIDRLVLRYDAAAKKTSLVVLDGTPDSAGPAAPDITRTALVYDLCLAEIRRPAGSTAVTAADITDTRADETVCGVMRDGVSGIPAATLIQRLRDEIDKVDKGNFYDKTETDALLDALQEQVETAAAAATKPVIVWAGDLTPNSYKNITTITLPDSVDYLVIKESAQADDLFARYLFPGEEFSRSDCNRNHMKFNEDRTLQFYNDAYGGYGTRNYLVGYHKESYEDGVKIPQVVGYKIVSSPYASSSFTVDDSVDFVTIQWKTTKSVSISGGDGTANVEVSNSVTRLRGSGCGLYTFSQDGKLSLPGTKDGYVSTTYYYTFYHYVTPEELAAQQTSTQAAQADTDAMTVDQEYRIALLELGLDAE